MIKHVKLILVPIFLLVSCNPFQGAATNRGKAEKLHNDKQYEQAIEAYQRHIEERLAVKDRPEWENPYIYLLDIGDIYLEQGDLTRALLFYQEAEANKVKQDYVNDRYRHAAAWLEKQGKLTEALELLKKYRDRDAYLFDLMLDRIAREIVRREDEAEAQAGKKAE